MSARIPEDGVALVTGSSSGFGLLTCLELARRGMRVFASMRDTARAERLDAAFAEAGLTCEKVRLDVTEPDSIAAAVATVRERVGPIDVLVNNAGYGIGGFIEDLTVEEIRAQFETNFFGLVAVTKAVIPAMREQRRGRIVNISSIGGRIANPGLGAYAASKFAVEGLSESLRLELLPHGVYVVLIEPGSFRTDIFDRNRRIGERVFDEASPNYETALRLEEIVDSRLAANRQDPIAVARAVARAVFAERPRLRYRVGRDAHALTAVRAVLPFEVWERAVTRLVHAKS